FQAEDGIRDFHVTGVQTCALPIYLPHEDQVAGVVMLDIATALLALLAEKTSGSYKPLSPNSALQRAAFGIKCSAAGGRAKSAHRSEERRVGKEHRSRRGRRQGGGA